MAGSPCLSGSEKRHWWLPNRKIVEKSMKDARSLIASKDQDDIASALRLLESVLSLSPRYELALELKARCLLSLRRFRDVADMLQDYIPSLRMAYNNESNAVSSELSSTQLSRDRVKLLNHSPRQNDSSFKCFSVSDLKKKVMAGLCKNCDKEGQWRYIVLGQACCHLGLMEDAMVLLQTGKRLATAAFRRESICRSDDSFALFSAASSPPSSSSSSSAASSGPQPGHLTESDGVAHMLSHMKLLLRRRAAALAALDAGLYSESIRHFSKIVDSRRGAPQAFLAECYMHRASAYRAAGRIAESIADCNKTLALEPSWIQALETRAALFESIRCFPDSLHDLEHLKLLYNSILRDRKLPGPVWKRHNVRYREIPGKLCVLTSKIQRLKEKIADGEIGNVDYYALLGIRRGCSKSELERAYLLLNLRHKPDRSISFIDRLELTGQEDTDSVKDRAKMSALLLYRLIQKGYSAVMFNITEEEAAAEKQRIAAAAAAAAAIESQQALCSSNINNTKEPVEIPSSNKVKRNENRVTTTMSNNANMVTGVSFCRDLAAVGNLISRSRFNHPITVKYEALSC